jgi:glycosyltransferase involved in cell wall biosynthesis
MAGQFRILYYSDALNTGGAEGYITHVARAAMASGYRAEAAVAALPALDAWAEELRRSGLAVHRLAVIRSLRNPGPFLRQLGFFLRHRYHLIHFNQVDPWSCAGGILAARLAGQSGLVSTDHLPNTVYEVPVPFRARMAPYLLRRRIVSAACHLARMPDPAAARRRGVRVVRNGVSLADPVTAEERAALRTRLDLPSVSPVHGGAPLVGTVGRLTGQKDHQTLVRAAAAVPGAAFAIIGDGPERGRLEALRDRLGLQDRFHLLGRRPDGVRFMRAFDVFAFPSLYEGMPFALLEAMGAGLAIVASAVPEIQEMIHNEEHGLLVPPSDPDALALALNRMLDAPARAAGWGAAAQARTAVEFTQARMARETLAVYADALGERPERPAAGNVV